MTDKIEIPADILDRFAALKRDYAERPKKANVLLYGPPGSGKTRSLLTAPAPIYIDSFDPGGTRTLEDEIAKGRIIADTRWEQEDDFKPTVWDSWKNDLDLKEKMGLPSFINTYVIDSATMMVEAALNHVKGNKKGPATLPEYNLRQINVRKELKRVLNWPCNIVIIAHPDYEKDQVTGKVIAGPLGGKMAIRFPIMFDEIYYAMTKEGSTGVDYSWAIRPSGVYFARSRLFKGGDKSVIFVEQNFKKALKDAGFPWEDKELPKL